MLFLLQITWYSHVTYAYSSLDILYKSYGSRNSLKVIWGHSGQKIILTKNAISPTGCTPLIQSHILHSVKEHVQKRKFHQFKTSWCTKNQAFPGKIRTFSIPQAVFFVGECSSTFH